MTIGTVDVIWLPLPDVNKEFPVFMWLVLFQPDLSPVTNVGDPFLDSLDLADAVLEDVMFLWPDGYGPRLIGWFPRHPVGLGLGKCWPLL